MKIKNYTREILWHSCMYSSVVIDGGSLAAVSL